MKLLLSILIYFLPIQDLPTIRESYPDATKSKENAEQFYNSLSKYNKSNPTILAYKGAAITLKAKFSTNKKSKKDFFIEGATMVENAVKSEPNNAEIRLVRMSIQENTPKLLKYKGNIEEDKKLILNSYKDLPADLKQYIADYAAQSKAFSAAEKQKLTK